MAPAGSVTTPSAASRLRALALWLAARLPPSLRRPLQRGYVTLFRPRAVHGDLLEDFGRLLGPRGAADLQARRAGAHGPRVLIATHVGSYQHGVAVDALLGVALTLRGAHVDFIQCDAVLPACQAMGIGAVNPVALADGQRPYFCATCTNQGATLYAEIGLRRLAMSELVDAAAVASIRERVRSMGAGEMQSIASDGVGIGEHALAGALRFYARGDLAGEAGAEGVLRRYTEGALVTAAAIERALDRERYDVVVAHHGIYVPQGIVADVCRRRGVRLVTWNPAYRRHCFVFSHGNTYHHTMVSEPTAAWEDMPWSDRQEHEIMRYLDSRLEGDEDWISFHTSESRNASAIASKLGTNPSRPLVTLLSNVVWDARLHYPSNAFPSMLDWVMQTIRYFARRPELQLVIRVHPAEITGFLPSRQHLAKEIAKAFPQLPPNVFVVGPGDDVSTYDLCDSSNAVLIYNTKTGIETTAKGIPTVVAGEAWIRNKGFCYSPETADEYFSVLDRVPFSGRMSEAERRRALKYAYHIFFRRMIPLPFLTGGGKDRIRVDLASFDQIEPGRWPGLDVICDGIISGSEFVYPADDEGRSAIRA